MSWWTTLLRNVAGGGPSEIGKPRSSNGASSFHLIWEMPPGYARHTAPGNGFAEVSAVLEVLEEPRTDELYFWALQVDFLSNGQVWGGGHTGLQWNQRHRGRRAINWGGYSSPERGGLVLAGTASSLEGFADDPNTLSYSWKAGRPYRLRVFRSPEIPGAWRSEIADLCSGISSTIRDLLPECTDGESASYLTNPVVWSEVFADCDSPSVVVRWSRFEARDDAGAVIMPEAVRVNYQSAREGGCSNTNAVTDGTNGILQVTNTPRTTRQGSRLLIPGESAV